MRLKARTRVHARPQTVFRFFEEMEDNYIEWHPDHITFRWLTDGGLRPGAKAYFEERIGGKHQAKTVRFTEVTPARSIQFRPTNRVIRLLLPRISFTIEPRADGCELIQELTIRTGPIGAWLNRREFDAVRTHMREEGDNLRRILESRNGEATE